MRKQVLIPILSVLAVFIIPATAVSAAPAMMQQGGSQVPAGVNQDATPQAPGGMNQQAIPTAPNGMNPQPGQNQSNGQTPPPPPRAQQGNNGYSYQNQPKPPVRPGLQSDPNQQPPSFSGGQANGSYQTGGPGGRVGTPSPQPGSNQATPTPPPAPSNMPAQ